jgi:hypothetical protein
VAREVIFKTWCDLCLAAEQKNVEGIELPALALPEVGNKPRVVALCEVHRKELYDPLVEVLREHGQIADEAGQPTGHTGPRGPYKKRGATAKENVPGGMDCPQCGHNSPNRSALSSHVRNMHDATLGEVTGRPTPYECPECGRGFVAPQGVAAHRRIAHGVPGSGKAGRSPAPGADEELPVAEAGTG